jgi:hypothetical protein
VCRLQSVKRVISNKKLLLVLDLDHTLLNSTQMDEVSIPRREIEGRMKTLLGIQGTSL